MTHKPTYRVSLVDRTLDKVSRVLEVGSEAADVLVHLQGGATPIGLTAVGLRVIQSARKLRAQEPESFFMGGWLPLDLGPLLNNVYASLQADPDATEREIPGLHEDTPARLVEIDGLTIGFALTLHTVVGKAEPRGCWVEEGVSSDAVISRMGRSLWETLKSTKAVVTPRLSRRGMQLVFEAEQESEIFPSRRGDQIYQRAKRFLDAGHHRSIFLIGEPGVGKSCILRYIADLHGGFSLRIKLSDLGNLNASSLIKIVQILRPTTLIIDDFDRFVSGRGSYHEEDKQSDQASNMLDPLVYINETVSLFMVSANFSQSITAAVLRPGRFDEPILIDELDPKIYKQLLPEAPPKILKRLKSMKVPVAYLQELKKRVEVLGYQGAVAEMEDLLERNNRIQQLNERVVRRRSRKSNPHSLVGKTPIQRAKILQKRADAYERKAKSLLERAEVSKLAAEKEQEKSKT